MKKVYCSNCKKEIRNVEREIPSRSRYRFHIKNDREYSYTMYSFCKECFNKIFFKNFELLSDRGYPLKMEKNPCMCCEKIRGKYIICRNTHAFKQQENLIICSDCMRRLFPKIIGVLI